jgi:transcriptional regulator with XRE-family HTH domain
MKTVLKNIKQRREQLNYSQEYVAFELKLSQAAYSKFEAGKSEFGLGKFITLCRILQSDLNDMMKDNPTFGEKNNNVEERLVHLEKELTLIKSTLLKKVEVD